MGEHSRITLQCASVETAGSSALTHVAVIGNALPRRCGLATFTSDIAAALRQRFPGLTVDHYAMDDGSGVVYPAGINPIVATDPWAYREAAGLIELSGAEAIWVQHEFGIFGGEAGSHILELLDRSTLPVVATLHTVLEAPSAPERKVFERLLDRAAHVIIMAESGRAILRETYGVDDARISVIPHGVPDRPYIEPEQAKARFGLTGRKVVMTFGLLAPDKGVDVMIDAMPAIVAAEPDATYIIIGATHPNLVRDQGESYRQSLHDRAATLGVADNIRFIDAFLEQNELLDWLEACDVYVTPYLNLAQITSGTLSYALALGKPVVSTPYRHAAEILADGHGVLVPPRDAPALAEAVGRLLSDDDARQAIAKRAYTRGRELLWPRVAEHAVRAIERSRYGWRSHALALASSTAPLSPSLDAVVRMTDSTGMLQHGLFSIADRRHGYCIDDNARALILMCRLRGGDRALIDRLASTYAAFVQHGWNPDRGRFRNFMRYDRSWCEDEGSEDSNGRTLWALGCAAAQGPNRAMRSWARSLFDEVAHLTCTLNSPRAHAFAALGATELLTVLPDHAGARRILETAGAELERLLSAHRRPDWLWYEPVLAYDNARLPEAVFRCGMALDNSRLIAMGVETLDWLETQQSNDEGRFRPVGSDSFGRPFATPLPFDQQPLEAQATIDACIAAHDATGDARWLTAVSRAYCWFLGANDLGLPLASGEDGGCYDGLMPHGVNLNQGAESILALQLANVAMSALSGVDKERKARDAA